MPVLDTLYNELLGFLGLGPLLEMYQKGDYSPLATAHGVFGAISPVIPFLLLIEIGRALTYKRFKIEDYRMPFFIFVANRFISRFISIAAIAFCIGLFEKYAILTTKFTWYWLI